MEDQASLDLGEVDAGATSKRNRDRSREGAGKSKRSWIKHGLIRRAAGGQIGCYRAKNDGRILLIDGNAGDGIGVEESQLDFFDASLSRPTPEILTALADQLGSADVLLCERAADKRLSLRERFPQATVISDHAIAIKHVREEHTYALWVSDPCGPSEHGIGHMRSIAQRLPLADFVVVFNEGWILSRCCNTKSTHWATHRKKFPPMLPPEWWLSNLQRRHFARTNVRGTKDGLINGAENFRYRVLVISNFLTDAVKRRPFEVIR